MASAHSDGGRADSGAVDTVGARRDQPAGSARNPISGGLQPGAGVSPDDPNL